MKKIQLSKGKVAIVDDCDFDYLNTFKWYADAHRNTWYAVRDQRMINIRFQMRMHSFIIGNPLYGFVIDHINGDGLDNRRSNLRIVSQRVNSQNRYYHRNGSKPVGVSFDKRRNLWESKIYVNGKKKFLGYFKSEEMASEKYQEYLKSGLLVNK